GLAEGENPLLHFLGRIPCPPRRRTYRHGAARPSCLTVGRSTSILFSDAERAEDQVQNVVGRGCSRDRIQRPQRGIEIEQQHLVRNLSRYGSLCRIQRSEGILDQPLMPNIRDETWLR